MSSSGFTSPFPPIAEYGFLSDCHTGALVAADGSVDWLCVPSFDSPSMFGSVLDRGAGYFRFAPYGINVPTARTYLPGTNVLVTTWHTPGGWLEVRDALTMGPRTGPDETTPHTRPPADDDAEHLLVRTAVCVAGSVEIEAVCEAALRLRPGSGNVDPSRRRQAGGRRIGRRGDRPAAQQPSAGHRGQRGEGQTRVAAGRDGVLCAVLGGRVGRPGRCRGRGSAAGCHHRVLATLAGPRTDPGPPAASLCRALRADHQGTDVHAHRRDCRCPDDVAARDPGR